MNVESAPELKAEDLCLPLYRGNYYIMIPPEIFQPDLPDVIRAYRRMAFGAGIFRLCQRRHSGELRHDMSRSIFSRKLTIYSEK